MHKILLLALLCGNVQARVFKFSEEGAGTYFKFGGATSILGQDAFVNSSGSAVVFDKKKVTHAMSGEIGGMVTTSVMNLRFGLGAMQPVRVISVGSNASGAELFTLTSSIQAPYASLGIEINLRQTDSTRMYVGLGGSMMQVALSNNYVFTTTGESELSAVSYIEESTAQVIAPELAFNFEWLMVDTTTMNWEFGYRQFQVTGLKYKSDVTTIGGPVTSGSEVTNSAGGKRVLDLSGIFINLGFRFYLNM